MRRAPRLSDAIGSRYPGLPREAVAAWLQLAVGIAPVVPAWFRPAGDQAKRTPVCRRSRSAVAERAATAGKAERSYARGCQRVDRGWTDRRRRPCLQASGTPNPARRAQRPAGRPVRGAGASEPRAGTVTPLSVRTLNRGDVGSGCNFRPSSVWQSLRWFGDGGCEGNLEVDKAPDAVLDI